MADISTALFVMSEAAILTPPPLLASGQMATVERLSTLAPSPPADCWGDPAECDCWHGRLAHDASARRSRHAFRHLSNGCGDIGRRRSES